MTQNNQQSNKGQAPKTNRSRTQGTDAEEAAHRAFEQDRLHPALRLDQQYPTLKPDRRWSALKDDATAPARPFSAGPMTDLGTDMDQSRKPDENRSGMGKLSLLMGFIIILGIVILLLLLTRSTGL